MSESVVLGPGQRISPGVLLPGEERGQVGDRPAHGSRASSKRFGAQEGFPVGELYVDGRLAIHIHFRLCVPGLEPDSRDWCVVVYEPCRLRDQGFDGWVAGYGFVPSENDPVEGQLPELGGEQTMLVSVGESLDVEKGVLAGSGRAVRSVVRLNPVESCDRIRADIAMLDHPEACEVISFGADWERYVPEDFTYSFWADFFDGEIPGNQVERGEALVSHVPREDAKPWRRHSLDPRIDAVPSRFSVKVNFETVEVSFADRPDSFLKSIEVFYAPIPLGLSCD